MIKKLLTILAAAIPMVCVAQSPSFKSFDLGYFGTNGLTISNLWRALGTNVLIIDNATGNDAVAAANPYLKAWKTAYNIASTNAGAHGAYGACTVAQPGDWIVFMNSTAPYLVPQVPLNLNGNGAGGGFNLLVMPGATLIATNYSNSDVTGTYHVNLASAGPMIMMGNNSKVVLLGVTINTNDFSQGAASIGLQITSTGFPFTGVSNAPVTNFYVYGGQNQMIYGDADCVYFGAGNSAASSGTFEGVHTSSGWDSFFFTGSAFTITNINCHAYSSIFPTNGISHGLNISAGTFYDLGSTYIATGSTNLNNQNTAAIDIVGSSGARVYLHGTEAIAVSGPNVVPVAYNSSPVFGDWSETDTNNITAFFAQTYKFGETVIQIFTNKLVLSLGGQTGPGNVNLTYGWDFTGTTFTNAATHFVTNSAGTPGPTTGTWLVLGGANYRYISITGFLGPYAITNASTAPPPNADYLRTTNFNVSALGDITQTNFVSGQLYTNQIGRPISVRAAATLTAAAVSGTAEMDLSVDQTQSGTFTTLDVASMATAVTTVAGTYQGDLSGFIVTNGVYTFTNTSTGAGNSSAVKAGTGQTIIH